MSSEFLLSLAVTLVTGTFAAIVGSQWRARRRPYQASWFAALVMATVAAASYMLFLAFGRPAVLFRLYYLFGAALNVTFLGLGSLYLMFRRSLRPLVEVLIVVSIVESAAIFAAPIDHTALSQATGAGTNVFALGPWLPLLIVMNTFGTLCLIGVALISAWNTFRRGGAAQRAVANVIIAAGALLIAAAGTMARLAGAASFWLVMLAGWVVLFTGFLYANRVMAPARLGRGIAPKNLSPSAPAGGDATMSLPIQSGESASLPPDRLDGRRERR